MNVINGQTYLEFMLPMFEFQAAKIETVSTQNNSGAAVRTKTFEYYDDFEYCVSVRHSIDDTAYSLYHPDNSNIGADANTNTLWLTHYNSVVKGGGVIGNSPNLISGQTTQYWTHAYFTPTQYEGVYKLEKYVTSPSTGLRRKCSRRQLCLYGRKRQHL